ENAFHVAPFQKHRVSLMFNYPLVINLASIDHQLLSNLYPRSHFNACIFYILFSIIRIFPTKLKKTSLLA
ncbi:MAG: hypothetical protein ABI371_02685, partial [Gelidibacter sp.]